MRAHTNRQSRSATRTALGFVAAVVLSPVAWSGVAMIGLAADMTARAEGPTQRTSSVVATPTTPTWLQIPGGGSPGGSPGPRFHPEPGSDVYKIWAPAIGLDETVVYGADPAQLAVGPGHYPSCGAAFQAPYCDPLHEDVWPGQRGRVIIGGHRTIQPATFNDLGELRRGDQIFIGAKWGDFVYEISRRRVVDAYDRSIVLDDVTGRQLVLVACHPKGSSALRVLVYARLVPGSDVSSFDVPVAPDPPAPTP